MNYETFHQSLKQIIDGAQKRNEQPFEALVQKIPTVDQLKLSPGDTVLVRFDLDLPLHEGKVLDMSRIEVGTKTIRYLLKQKAKIVLFGHLGRDGKSLESVCKAMQAHLGINVTLVADWIDQAKMQVNEHAADTISAGEAGSIFMLENTRKFEVERALWKKKSVTKQDTQPLFQLAQSVRERISKIEVNEALAASNLDFSSAVLPLVMDQTAMGYYVADELKQHMTGARTSSLVVISGAKADKLQYIEDILHGGHTKYILAAGGLAMALHKAKALIAGSDLCIGKAENDQSYKGYLGPESIETAKRVVLECERRGVELALPCDYVLDDGSISESIPVDQAQWDVGPKSRQYFAQVVRKFIREAKSQNPPAAAFYNGAFGIFEKEAFAEGTKAFVPLLGEMTKGGIQTYVGGGEGRTSLLTFGQITDVHHAFTAGGTVLKSLAGRIVPYVLAMFLQNQTNSQ